MKEPPDHLAYEVKEYEKYDDKPTGLFSFIKKNFAADEAFVVCVTEQHNVPIFFTRFYGLYALLCFPGTWVDW